MGLEKYQQKRNFEKSSEPTGSVKKSAEKLHFVVQKHQASRLHYDFRLELKGVLKSWAVPKGPSLNPEDKHLAIMVEDHPIQYGDFEGVIPKGNYGAGTVMVWDKGTYHAFGKNVAEDEKFLLKGLKDGHITFILEGQKLKGEFALIKLKKSKDKDAWLLLKADKDDFASSENILLQDKSAKSGLKIEEITQKSNESGKFWTQRMKNIEIDAPQISFPHNIKPMMATLVKEPFDGDEWIFEIKWDGYRVITEVEKQKVNLYSRNGKSFQEKFPSIVNAFQSYRKDVIFDGEVVVIDTDGKPSFQMLQDYFLTGQGNLIYYVFDILYFEGKDLKNLTLSERKKILKKALPKVPNVKYSEEIKFAGKQFFQLAKKEGLEGIVAKKIDSKYHPESRSKDWLKIKAHLEQEVVIVGYTKGHGARNNFGSLITGVYENNKLEYTGNVGTGFNEKMIDFLLDKFYLIEQKGAAFSHPPKLTGVVWLKPVLTAQVKFQEWTKEGHMRQPVFLGLREDKNPNEVIKEF